jgi:hypothetical protein
VATGRGQSGTTASNSIYSTNAGQSWTAGGAMANISNVSPFSLRAGAHNGSMIAAAGATSCWLTVDQGLTWSTFARGISFGCQVLESGNGLFVYLDNAAANVYSSANGQATLTTNTAPATLGRAWWNPNRSLWLCFENGGTRSWTTPDLVTYTAGPAMPRDSGLISPYGISQNGSNIILVYADAVSNNATYSLDDGVTFSASATFPGGVTQSRSVVHGNGMAICTVAIGSAILVTNDKGATWALGNANTATKTWNLGYDGTNGWLAAGASGSDDTILNVGVC